MFDFLSIFPSLLIWVWIWELRESLLDTDLTVRAMPCLPCYLVSVTLLISSSFIMTALYCMFQYTVVVMLHYLSFILAICFITPQNYEGCYEYEDLKYV